MSRNNGNGASRPAKKRLAVYDDHGIIPYHAETVYDPRSNSTKYALYHRGDKTISYVDRLKWPGGEEIYPEDGGGSGLLEKRTVLLPSEAAEYSSEEELLDEIQGFIRTYMVMPEEFYLLASHYVLLTWIADCFPAVPYLRARADTGMGKSRFLKTVGALSYASIHASGATTASPIFRIYEIYRRGTFIFDEADWDQKNDEFGEITKILNFGYEKGASVLRSMVNNHEVEPRAYDVFGPKILATRNDFSDSALESRCFTVALRVEKQALQHIPENIGLSFWDQAQAIRNKLLTWRFHRFHILDEVPSLERHEIHPRLRMLMTPMIMTREHQDSREELINYLAALNRDVQDRRAMDLEAEVMEALMECVSTLNPIVPADMQPRISTHEIMKKLNEKREADGSELVSVRKVHSTLKSRLNIKIGREKRKYVILDEPDYIAEVAEQFGLKRSDFGYEGAQPTEEEYVYAPPGEGEEVVEV